MNTTNMSASDGEINVFSQFMEQKDTEEVSDEAISTAARVPMFIPDNAQLLLPDPTDKVSLMHSVV